MNAKDLLLQVLDFVCFWQNDINKFAPLLLEGQEPSYYRLMKLEALFKAFDLTSDQPIRSNLRRFTVGDGKMNEHPALNTKSNLEHFISGEFIDCIQDLSVYTEQIDVITAKVIELLPSYSYEKRDYHPYVMMSMLFSKLFRFRKDIHRFTQKDRNLQLNFSFADMYARYLTEQLSIEIADKINVIDCTLSLIIDPKQKEISKKDLIEKYGYPDIDLTDIDLEFKVNNW